MTTATDTRPSAATGTTPVAGDTNRALVVGGSLLTAAMIVTNAGNYALNLLLGRWLAPSRFADANLMVTIMLLVTAVAVTVQLVAARSVSVDGPEGAGIARWLERKAALLGLAIGLVLAAGATSWQQLLHTASPWPFVILAAGMPFYLAQAVGRGSLQGRLSFGRLSATFLVEMVVRLGTGVLLVVAGLGVNGATAALSASLIATWAAVRLLNGGADRDVRPAPKELLRPVVRYFGLVSVLLIGQVIINNSDVLAAKRFLPAAEAGRYAAVGLVGRAVFFLSWSIATTVFPAVAARHAAGRPHGSVLRGSVVAVAALGGLCSLAALAVGGPVLAAVLGPDYQGLGRPLAAYAAVTTVFAVANLVATHHLSVDRVLTSWVVVAGGVLQVLLLCLNNGSIAALIADQAVAMVALLLLVALVASRPQSHMPRQSRIPRQKGVSS